MLLLIWTSTGTPGVVVPPPEPETVLSNFVDRRYNRIERWSLFTGGKR